jgi:hypothetical protein
VPEPVVQPIERSPIPVGTIAEAEREGLDPAAYATCSRPNRVTGVVGCPWFDRCRVSAKGQNGPKNYGVEIVKGAVQGGGFVKMHANCMWIADHAETYEKNGGVVKVTCEEGEPYEHVTYIAVNAVTNEPTHQKDPQAIRVQRRVKATVPKFPRPGENPALLTDLLRAESIEAEKERRHDEAKARAYGLADTIAPIDKRSAGADGGRKASGGGKP